MIDLFSAVVLVITALFPPTSPLVIALGAIGTGAILSSVYALKGAKAIDGADDFIESYADLMSPEDAKKYLEFLENGSTAGLTPEELAGIDKLDELLALEKVEWDDIVRIRADVYKGGSYASPNKIDSLLDGRPELTGSTRDKLLATVQDPELGKIVNELYRPGATVGDGGTAAILVEEFSKGSSTHLLKETERLKQLKKLASSGKLGLNDLEVVEALIDDLESAISLYN